MPIRFDLEQVRKVNNCVNYFETGLFNPQYEVSFKQALLYCNFKTLHSIEIRKEWVDFDDLSGALSSVLASIVIILVVDVNVFEVHLLLELAVDVVIFLFILI